LGYTGIATIFVLADAGLQAVMAGFDGPRLRASVTPLALGASHSARIGLMRWASGRWQRGALLGFGLGGLVVLTVLWNKAPDYYRLAKDPAAAAATTRTGILAAAAGFVAFTGVMLNLIETRRANEHTHVRELYTQAVNQLGSDVLSIRIGGIYALERIMYDSERDHATVVEVLTAFICERSRISTSIGEPNSTEPPNRIRRPPIDVQAALTVLGRRPKKGRRERGPLRLAEVDLRGADLCGADLRRATFAWSDLEGANLFRANLLDANLKHSNLKDANLRDASLVNTFFAGATLDNTTLAGVDLRSARGLQKSQVDTAEIGDGTLLPNW
jgi:hypothetical protein